MDVDHLKRMPPKQLAWDKDKLLDFKEEPIYLKKDIVELHTNERWRKEKR